MNMARIDSFQVSCGCGAMFKLNSHTEDPTNQLQSTGVMETPGTVLAAALEHAERTGHGMDVGGRVARVRRISDGVRKEIRSTSL